jgi:hypothetical protein
MPTINDYRIVVKTFVSNDGRLSPGQPVDTSIFRNVRGLEEGRYLRRPNSEEDFRLIEEAIKATEENEKPPQSKSKKQGVA